MRLRDTDISPDLYGVLPSQNTPATRFTAPSAVHLTAGSWPDSHHRRLSVQPWLPLSPLHRFQWPKFCTGCRRLQQIYTNFL